MLFVTPRTVAHQAPLSMRFFRQEYWCALPFRSPGDLSNPGIEPMSPLSPALAGDFFTTAPLVYINSICSVLYVSHVQYISTFEVEI